jgi:hypothetical protein
VASGLGFERDRFGHYRLGEFEWQNDGM